MTDEFTAGALCYPVRGDEVLLIRHKRGIGEGKINGPGGKVESGETPREAAVREVEEETSVHVSNLEKVGELAFEFGGEPGLFVHVFRADDLSGTPEESEEAIPSWHPIDDLPYKEMWEDDREWLPFVFDGETFAGEYRFDADGDELLGGHVERDVTFE